MENYSEILAKVRLLGLTEYDIDEWHIKDNIIKGLELGRHLDIYLPYLDGIEVELNYITKNNITKDDCDYPHYRLKLDKCYRKLNYKMLKINSFSEISGEGIELVEPLSFSSKYLKFIYLPNCLEMHFSSIGLHPHVMLYLKDFKGTAKDLRKLRDKRGYEI